MPRDASSENRRTPGWAKKAREADEADRRKVYAEIPFGHAVVTLADEGVVVDIIADNGDVMVTTWKLFAEMGISVTDDVEPE